MFDDENDDDDEDTAFIWVLGVLITIFVIVFVVARSGDPLRGATVTGDTIEQTEAPSTTESPTTTGPPEVETTTAAPVTTAPAPEAITLWDALGASGQSERFAAIGEPLGLRADLDALIDADGNPVDRTLFAPSDDAVAQVDQAVIESFVTDPATAAALIGYHFLDARLSIDELAALDGETVLTRTGLPLAITVVDGEVILNGSSRITAGDFNADNGVVHIVDALLDPPTVNEIIGLENIEFEVSSARITVAGQAELEKAVAFFIDNPDLNAQIEGHTDTDGADEQNLTLSQSRADSVMEFLVNAGIDGDRLTAIGYGETQPILVDGVEDKPASRRIELVVR